MENYETLHLRAMRENDQSHSFDKKTSNMCKMHKNRQNSVDSINNICFDVGMDARELKKQLLAEMLLQYQSIWDQQDEDAKKESAAILMDIDYYEDGISDAAYARYVRVMDKLVDDAMAKAGH